MSQDVSWMCQYLPHAIKLILVCAKVVHHDYILHHYKFSITMSLASIILTPFINREANLSGTIIDS